MRQRIDAITDKVLPAEYFTAQRIANQAEQKIATMTAPPQPPGLDPFQTGELTDDWLDAEVDSDTDRTRWDEKRKRLLALMRDAQGRAGSIRHSCTDQILSAYHAELVVLLAEVRELSHQLGDADTAEKAIAADAGPQWKRLVQLAADYDDLRAAQHNITPTGVTFAAKAAFGEAHASDLYLNNLDDIWPNWRTPGQGKDHIIHINGAEHRHEPWPRDRVQLLLWLVRSQAQPWIPTQRQLQRHTEQRIDRANPNPKVIAHRPDQPGEWQPINRQPINPNETEHARV